MGYIPFLEYTKVQFEPCVISANIDMLLSPSEQFVIYRVLRECDPMGDIDR